MARLLRLDPGQRAPGHGHERRDVTVVLQGAYADAYGVYEKGDLAFDVTRNGDPLGTHILTSTRQGDALTVKTAIQFKVAFGPITFFDYVHDVTETYLGKRLT